ncbi:hypothetical protein HanPI659440_Chr07g0266201 [Helianthus annuus]|nr:hypothetical protein HanIR_Chr07g0322671 [Helianthus annuus]KAJ0771191.1 hypothetical protein HanPI659440_Chr07g0266201 [Helianthus annuus]
MKLSSPFLLTTRFPESKSCATGFMVVGVSDDHTVVLLLPAITNNDPLVATLNTPDKSVIGVSLLATQTTVCGDMFLYHIPINRFVDLPGLKNPSSYISLAETRVSPSRMT